MDTTAFAGTPVKSRFTSTRETPAGSTSSLAPGAAQFHSTCPAVPYRPLDRHLPWLVVSAATKPSMRDANVLTDEFSTKALLRSRHQSVANVFDPFGEAVSDEDSAEGHSDGAQAMLT